MATMWELMVIKYIGCKTCLRCISWRSIEYISFVISLGHIIHRNKANEQLHVNYALRSLSASGAEISLAENKL